MPSLPRNCLDDAVEGIIATNSTDGSDRTILAKGSSSIMNLKKKKTDGTRISYLKVALLSVCVCVWVSNIKSVLGVAGSLMLLTLYATC